MSYVRVFNGTETTVTGRYDGEDYDFPSGGHADVPEVVARHVWGFGVPDKSAVLARLGWMTTSDQIPHAKDKLKKIRIEAIEMVGRPIAEEDDSATSQDIAPARIGAASPRVSSDGTTGVDSSTPEDPIDTI